MKRLQVKKKKMHFFETDLLKSQEEHDNLRMRKGKV